MDYDLRRQLVAADGERGTAGRRQIRRVGLKFLRGPRPIPAFSQHVGYLLQAASDLQHAVDVVSGGGIDLTALISHRYPIAQAPDAFATLATRSGIKVIVNP